MNLLESYVYGKDDVKLFIRKDIPMKAKCIVLVAHGYMEHSGRYIEFAEKLVKENIGVCMIDHRGNGRSEGKRGDTDDFFDFVEDIHFVVSSLKKYQLPIVTFGHSMGGLITFLYALNYHDHITGQIFSAPALGVPMGCKNLPAIFYESVGSLLGDVKVHKMGGHISIRNELYMKAFQEEVIKDQYATMRFIDQFLRIGIEHAITHVEDYDMPCLFLMGDKDFVIPISRNRTFFAKIKGEKKCVIEYPGCMHDLLHDLDNEVKKITQDILKWIERHTSELEIDSK